MSALRHDVLVLVIEDEPIGRFWDLPSSDEVVVDVGGRRFRSAGSGDMNGFYDFLRAPSGVVGVRFWPYPHAEFLASLVKSGEKIISTDPPNPSVVFFPGGRQDFDRTRSDDQDMVKNYLLGSEDNAYAVTFAVDRLTEQEYRSLQELIEG